MLDRSLKEIFKFFLCVSLIPYIIGIGHWVYVNLPPEDMQYEQNLTSITAVVNVCKAIDPKGLAEVITELQGYPVTQNVTDKK